MATGAEFPLVAVGTMGAPLSSTLIAGIASLRLQRAAAAVCFLFFKNTYSANKKGGIIRAK